MVSDETKLMIARSKEIYSKQLKSELEPMHTDEYVAIEPDSGDYFLGDTFDAAVKLARAKHPSKLSHTIRIGHKAAFQIGVLQ